jgi:hypothetical protein
MREADNALLRKECAAVAIEDYYIPLTVSSTAQAVDEYGDAVTTYGKPREFMGYVGKPNSGQAVAAAQRGVRIDGRLYAPVDAGIKAFDVVHDAASGQRFQVVSEPRDAARRGHHVEADLLMLRGGEGFADS